MRVSRIFKIPIIVALSLAMVILMIFFLPSPLLSAFYPLDTRVGAESCRSCHETQFQVWENTPHAKSHQGLPPKYRQNNRCLFCHSLGQKEHLQGVQCESCHGAGHFYQRSNIMKDKVLAKFLGLRKKGQEICWRCHTKDDPSLLPFDWEKKFLNFRHSLKSE